MRSVVDRNIVMRRMTVQLEKNMYYNESYRNRRIWCGVIDLAQTRNQQTALVSMVNITSSTTECSQFLDQICNPTPWG
jgi:hypothetical protein